MAFIIGQGVSRGCLFFGKQTLLITSFTSITPLSGFKPLNSCLYEVPVLNLQFLFQKASKRKLEQNAIWSWWWCHDTVISPRWFHLVWSVYNIIKAIMQHVWLMMLFICECMFVFSPNGTCAGSGPKKSKNSLTSQAVLKIMVHKKNDSLLPGSALAQVLFLSYSLASLVSRSCFFQMRWASQNAFASRWLHMWKFEICDDFTCIIPVQLWCSTAWCLEHYG